MGLVFSEPYDFMGKKHVMVECSCGNEYSILKTSTYKKRKHDCCRKCAGKVNASNRTHGARQGGQRSKLYVKWIYIKEASYNKNSKDYIGLEMSSEWNDYSNFEAWAESNGYQDGVKLVKKNKTKGFTIDNVKFIPMKTSPKKFRIYGEYYSFNEAYDKFNHGASKREVRRRLRRGWRELPAFSMPINVNLQKGRFSRLWRQNKKAGV